MFGSHTLRDSLKSPCKVSWVRPLLNIIWSRSSKFLGDFDEVEPIQSGRGGRGSCAAVPEFSAGIFFPLTFRLTWPCIFRDIGEIDVGCRMCLHPWCNSWEPIGGGNHVEQLVKMRRAWTASDGKTSAWRDLIPTPDGRKFSPDTNQSGIYRVGIIMHKAASSSLKEKRARNRSPRFTKSGFK
jgi:hypothetical protein